jgi:hypothetical protein
VDAALSGGSDQGAALDKLKEVVGMLKQARVSQAFHPELAGILGTLLADSDS